MLEAIAQKIATHYLITWLSGPLISLHARVIGYRTELAVTGLIVIWLLEFAGVVKPGDPHIVEVKAGLLGVAGLAFADKTTKYSKLADLLLVKATALEAEKDDGETK